MGCARRASLRSNGLVGYAHLSEWGGLVMSTKKVTVGGGAELAFFEGDEAKALSELQGLISGARLEEVLAFNAKIAGEMPFADELEEQFVRRIEGGWPIG